MNMQSYYKIGDFVQINPQTLLQIVTIEHVMELYFCKEYHYSTYFIKELTCMSNELKVYHFNDLKDCEVVIPECKKDMNFELLEFGA